MDLTSIAGIGPAYSERLCAAGVPDVAALAGAVDLGDLSAKTGIPSLKLAEFQSAARRMADRTPLEAAREVAHAVKDAADDMRVVLRDTAATARVKIGSIWHDDVPIVTARFNEDGEKVVASLKENAVLLREQATTAVVRINDEIHRELPIFKDEARVRIREIKERAEEARAGVFSRMFRRGA